MTKVHVLPKEGDLIGFEQAVAGQWVPAQDVWGYALILSSDGTMSDASGMLFVKPCTQQEAAFYQTSIAEHPDFYEFMPAFLGTLELTQNQDVTFEQQSAALIAQHIIPEVVVPHGPTRIKKIVTNLALALENAAYGFKRPNILDVKLGVRLWADDAKQEKKTRFDKVTQETTHKNLGFRIAGMRAWQGDESKPDGLVDQDNFRIYDHAGYRIYDKEYGKADVHDGNVSQAFRKFFFSESAGVDEELGRLVIQAFLSDLAQIQEILENQESRMYSASLLFVFEGDGEALRIAMEEASKEPVYINGNGVDRDSDEEDSDEEDKSPKIYALKLIDFAHAEWVPGMGPDENILLGVKSVAKILSGLAAGGA